VPGGTLLADGFHLIIADCLAVSFQRYPEEMLGGPLEVPRSYGALPVELSSPTQAFLPTRDGEGIWLGLSPRNSQEPCVEVSWLDALKADDSPLPWSAIVSNLEMLHGLRKRNGTFSPFVRFPLARNSTPCPGVMILTGGHEGVQVRFTSLAEFEAKTGKPGPRPISPDDCYGGWLLP
jgi:hypothetical protein